jgi:hypothetical protein
MSLHLLRGGLPGASGQTGFPDLLSKIDNGIGGSYTITYKPSSAYSNQFLPYTVQTVSSIGVRDGVNTFTTTYDYEGGLHSYKEKEFPG